MKVSIVGSRTFNDYDALVDKINDLHLDITEIISGGARGADSLAKRYALEHDINLVEYIPDWDTHGKAAGFIRNKDIIKHGDLVIACWDGVSKGTKSSIDIANRLHKPVHIIPL